jgi:hypothetical protein
MNLDFLMNKINQFKEQQLGGKNNQDQDQNMKF